MLAITYRKEEVVDVDLTAEEEVSLPAYLDIITIFGLMLGIAKAGR